MNNRDFDSIGEVTAGEIGREVERWVGPFSESFPDFRMKVIDVIAEDDNVVGHFKCADTHRGEWRGHSPTGRRFEDVDEVYIFRVEEGKLASALAGRGGQPHSPSPARTRHVSATGRFTGARESTGPPPGAGR
jgi:SnoaL-like polyketide cyclase